MPKILFAALSSYFLLCLIPGTMAQTQDSIAMYGEIETVEVVRQRIQHANEANAGARITHLDPKLLQANKTRSLAELFADKEEYNSVDLEKIISGTVSAYKSMKTYDRYLGDIHFYINTKLTDFNAEVKLIAAVRKK